MISPRHRLPLRFLSTTMSIQNPLYCGATFSDRTSAYGGRALQILGYLRDKSAIVPLVHPLALVSMVRLGEEH